VKNISLQEVESLSHAFYESLKKLRQKKLYGLLVHAVDNLLLPGGERLWDLMRGLKDDGLVKKIGVSVYNAEQIDAILEKYKIDIIQLPIDVFDQRLLLNGSLAKLKKFDVEIHARSVFLQGVLLEKLNELPVYFKPFFKYFRRYYEFVYKNKWTPLQAAVGFVSGIDDIDVMIVGVNNASNLQAIVNAAKPLNSDLFKSFAYSDVLLLDPSRWKI